MVEAGNDGAIFGADLEAYAAAMREKAQAFFAQAGKDPLEVYRIETFEPIKQDAEWHGKFYDGDSYVVLKKQRANYDIHYWHGKNATAVSFNLLCLHLFTTKLVFSRTKWAHPLPCQCNFQTT